MKHQPGAALALAVLPPLLAGLIAALGTAPADAQEAAPARGDLYGPPPTVPTIPGVGGYGVVPNAPMTPMAATRPNTWPGGVAPAAPAVGGAAAWNARQQQPAGPYQQPAQPVSWQQPPPVSAVQLCELAQTVGKVGSEVILVSDVMAALDEIIEANADKVPPEQREAQRTGLIKEVMTAIDEAIAGELNRAPLGPEQEQHKALLQRLLKQQIESKLVYNDAKTKIPAEHFPNVEKNLTKAFEEEDVKRMMKQHGVKSYLELDQALRNRGTSFEREKRAFIERTLSHEWLRQQVKVDNEITFDQIYAYYHSHPKEFDQPAKTRWQELSLAFSEYPSKQEARAAMAAMGDQILAGANFEQIAKAAGMGLDGSVRDWPDKSRLVSPDVEKAIAGLPTGKPGQIIEDWRGVHIVRVVERLPARHVPFEEAQPEIRDKVKQQRTQTQMQTYLNRLKEQIPVWTLLDAVPGTAQTQPASSRR